ncbi:hypothetical protein LR48_Vigan252s002900 [Vigna angularis]|uniref:Ubiquitin-like protease family profile domain-containing protein n=1 Tax=Phaseolus angularis TaxID=3914 RepID=A0A0L9T6V7_PHAAN|nr:hypothetical protein LR48_Vigan252s002900 [Vigna angularis]
MDRSWTNERRISEEYEKGAKLEKKLRKSRADALGLESPDLAPAPARYELWKAARTKSDGNMTSSSTALISQRIFTRPQKQPIHDTVIHEDDDMAEAEDDPLSKLMTKLPRLKKAPLELYWDLRVFGLPPHVPVYITLSDALEMIGGDRMLNISIIQLWCMYMDTIVVDQGRSSIYGFVEPQTIQPSGNTLQNRQHYLRTWMDESKRDVYLVPYIEGRMKNDLRTMLQGVIGKSRGQLVQILYPKVCNQQLDSWECGFYVLGWIKTIIRAIITDDWNERFKSTSPIPEDTIKQIRQEWTAYLLSRWTCVSCLDYVTSNPHDVVDDQSSLMLEQGSHCSHRHWWVVLVSGAAVGSSSCEGLDFDGGSFGLVSSTIVRHRSLCLHRGNKIDLHSPKPSLATLHSFA